MPVAQVHRVSIRIPITHAQCYSEAMTSFAGDPRRMNEEPYGTKASADDEFAKRGGL
jgi:hypothetical protein